MTPIARTFALLLSLLALPALAATDYSLEATAQSLQTGLGGITRVPLNTGVVFGARLIRTGGPPTGPVTVEFDVPAPVENVMAYGGFVCTGTGPVRCEASSVPDPAAFIAHIETRMTMPGPVTATVRLINPSDENAANNTDTYVLEVVDKPSLNVYPSYDLARLEPLQQSEFSMQVSNNGGVATNVVATATLTSGGTITGLGAVTGNAPSTCTFTASVVTCVAASMPYQTYFDVKVKVVAPDRPEGGTFRTELRVTSSEGDFDETDNITLFQNVIVRHILVTNTRDEGGGSLRQALIEASVLCDPQPCTIDFRIPGPGPFVIQPRTQLPDVIGTVKVDGKTQTIFGGDTDPAGPEIEIDGSLQAEGNGLVMRQGCEIQVLDLAMHGFPNSALEARRGYQDYDTCNRLFRTLFPATLIARNDLQNNNRSLVVGDTDFATIEDNVLSNNRSSGLFAERVNYLGIFRNRFERNGASGMYLNIGTRDYYAGGADVSGNVIAHNEHWGIARTRNGEIAVADNSIFGNNFQGIDVGLDFETPNEPDDSGRPPNKPMLVSAAWDPATNKTIVRGSFASNNLSIGHFTLQLFASSSLSVWGQSQGETLVFSGLVKPGEFEVSVDGDQRGKYVTATLTRRHIIGFAKPLNVRAKSHLYSMPADTSEFSNAILVQ